MDTSASLLHRLRDSPAAEDWQRLVEVYTPLIRHWLRGRQVAEQDAEDIAQEVMGVLVRKLPQFEHNGRVGAFRAWLRSITTNCVRNYSRSARTRPLGTGSSDLQELLQQLEDPQSALSRLWDQEHDVLVTRRLLELLRPEFEATTWRAFERTALEGASAAETAAELGLTANAVFIAKSRVLSRLRREAEGLVD